MHNRPLRSLPPRRRYTLLRPIDLSSSQTLGGFRGVAWAVVIEIVAGLVCVGLWALLHRVL